MAGITLKGTIAAIGPVQTVGENKTEVQYMILHVAGFTDSFGDKKGRDQQWAIQAVGKKVAELKMTEALVNKRVEVKAYCESVCLESKEPGKEPFYVVNNTLASFTVIG